VKLSSVRKGVVLTVVPKEGFAVKEPTPPVIVKEVKRIGDNVMVNALARNPVAIRGNKELKTWIMQNRKFHDQFAGAPGVELYPEKKHPSDPDPVFEGLLGYLAGVPVWILPVSEKLDQFYIQFEYNKK